MTGSMLILTGIVLAVVVVMILWLGKRHREALRELQSQQQNNPALQFMQNQINHLSEEVSKSLRFVIEAQQKVGDRVSERVDKATQTMGERLDNAARVVGQVQKSLGALDQKAEQIFTIGKDISSLQEILRAPKLRGVLGEISLGDLLAQILPPKHFTLQYTFKSGETVDAVIRMAGDRLVPVDSKFPLENFRRMIQAPVPEEKSALKRKFVSDVKKHIDAISSKYILPDEGTFDFALMFVMAENVYYETIIKDENAGEEKSLVSYAFERHVIPVSPNSFYAYLQTISLGLRGLQIEEKAAQILEHMARLRGDFVRFEKDFEVLGSHITNTRNKYEEAEKRLERFGDKLEGALEAAPDGAPPLPNPSEPDVLQGLLPESQKLKP